MKNNWKDEFEDFWQSDYCTKDSIKKFISNLLSEQKKELSEEVEKATIYYYNDKAHFSEDDISTIINKLRV